MTHVATPQQREKKVGINTCKNFQILTFKKGMIDWLVLTTSDLWKSRGIGCNVFFIESEKFDPNKLGSSTIYKDGGRGQDLCLWFFEKVWFFTPFDWRSGIRTVSGMRLTCQCHCPPLPAPSWTLDLPPLFSFCLPFSFSLLPPSGSYKLDKDR